MPGHLQVWMGHSSQTGEFAMEARAPKGVSSSLYCQGRNLENHSLTRTPENYYLCPSHHSVWGGNQCSPTRVPLGRTATNPNHWKGV